MEMPAFYLNLEIMTTDTAPSKSVLAKPVGSIEVRDALVLHIARASYRNATFGGEYFLLDPLETAAYKPTSKLKEGWDVGIIFCGWFGTRLRTRGIALKYQIEGSQILHGWNGSVVSNIATDTPYVPKQIQTKPINTTLVSSGTTNDMQ